MRNPHELRLKPKEKLYLTKLVSSGRDSARKIRRARILLLRDKKVPSSTIGEMLSVCYNTVFLVSKRYLDGGLETALKERSRSGRPAIFDPKQRAKITALACTKAPGGRSRWSLRLLADYAVELGLVSSISHMEISRILKKTNLSLI